MVVIIHLIIPIFIGGTIYVLARSKTLLIFKAINFIGLTEQVDVLRTTTAEAISLFPGYFVYSIPDALWVYSLTFFLAYVWMDAQLAWYIGAITIAGCIALGSEIGQAFSIVQGTFDWLDFVLSGITFIIAILCIENKRRKKCVC